MKKQKCKRCQKTKPLQEFDRQGSPGQNTEASEICKDCQDKDAQARKQQVFKAVLQKAEALGLIEKNSPSSGCVPKRHAMSKTT